MARKFAVPIDMQQLQIYNLQLQQLGSDPVGPVLGQLWFNTARNHPTWFDGSANQDIYPFATAATASTGALRDSSGNLTAGTFNGALNGVALNATNLDATGLGNYQPGTYFLNFGNTTGTRTHTAISDFISTVETVRLDQMAPPQASVSFNGFNLTAVATPVNPTDGANKAYVDSVASGLQVKDSAQASTTAPLPSYTFTLTGGGTLTEVGNGALPQQDGYTPQLNDRLLVQFETGGNQPYNGIYVVTSLGSGSSPWILTRSSDANTSAEVVSGMFVFVDNGATYGSCGFVLSTPNPITLNTTPLTFAQFSGAGEILPGAGLNKVGNTFNVIVTARLQFTSNEVDLAPSGVSAGTYSLLTVDQYGRATSGADIVSTDGFVVKTAPSTFIARTITGTASQIDVSNGSGGGGNPTISIDPSYPGQTSLVTLGTVTTGLWNAQTIPIAYGGTGATNAPSAFANLSPMTLLGDMIYGGAAGVGTRLGGNTTVIRQFLNQTGTGTVSAAPQWGTLFVTDIPNLPASIITSGVFPIAQGGTNSTTALAGGYVMVSAGGAIVESSDLQDDGTTVRFGKRIALLENTPTVLSSNTNNYNPGGDATIYRLQSTAAVNLTGLINGTNGRVVVLLNVGSYTITLTNNDAGSTAANRFQTIDGNGLILAPNDAVTVTYDSTSLLWRVTTESPRIGVATNGTYVSTRPLINIIQGTGMTVSAVDNPTNGRVDITISAAAAALTKYTQTIGTGSMTSFSIVHNLGTLAVLVAVYNISTGYIVEADVQTTSANIVTLTFSVAPTTNEYLVVVVG